MSDENQTDDQGEDKPAPDSPPQENPDAVTATKKFNWTDRETETTKIYFPGSVIDNEEAAAWAIDQGHGEQRGLQSPSRILRPSENKARDLAREGGENKSAKKGRSKGGEG